MVLASSSTEVADCCEVPLAFWKVVKDAVLEGELNVLSVRCGLCWGTGVKDTSLKVEEENDPSRLLGLAENSEGPGLLRTEGEKETVL